MTTRYLNMLGSDRLTQREARALLEFLIKTQEKHDVRKLFSHSQRSIGAFYRAENKLLRALDKLNHNKKVRMSI